MDIIQIQWAINTGLLIILWFFVRNWVIGLNKMDDRLDMLLQTKMDSKLCDKEMNRLTDMQKEFWKHKHAPEKDSGFGGEVILR